MKVLNILIIILVSFVIIRLIYEFILYKKANDDIKVSVSYAGYPFLICVTIGFAILFLVEFIKRIGI